jgi:hypothetical protein
MIMNHLRLLGTCAAALLASQALAADKPTHRALIADHANGKLTLVEPATGKVLGHYGVEGPGRLKANDSGRLIYITQGRQGRINVFDSGITVDSHGDHFDVAVKPPRLLEASFTGGRPSHVNHGAGMTAIFSDETGTAEAVDEKALLAGKPRSFQIKADAPHHGLVVPMQGHFALSLSQSVDGRTVAHGLDVVKRGGTSVARSADCPRLHGEARVSGINAFGCTDGVLFLSENKGRYELRKATYPADLPQNRMVRNLAGSQTVRSFVGDFGADGMVVIDPATMGFSFVQLPARRLSFGRDQLNGELAFVVTEDGRLHRLNALTGKLEGSLAVTGGYSMEGGAAVARPRLSANGGVVVITDPAVGKAHVVDAAKMLLLRSIDIPGAPFDVAVVGANAHDH